MAGIKKFFEYLKMLFWDLNDFFEDDIYIFAVGRSVAHSMHSNKKIQVWVHMRPTSLCEYFLSPQLKYLFWVLKRQSVSLIRLFGVPTIVSWADTEGAGAGGSDPAEKSQNVSLFSNIGLDPLKKSQNYQASN